MKETKKSERAVGTEKKEAALKARDFRGNVHDNESLAQMCDRVLPRAIDLMIFQAKSKRLLKDLTVKHRGCI